MKDTCGAEIIALAGVSAVKVSECLDIDEMCTVIEFLGLLKHNLEVIKTRALLRKLEEKKDNKDQKGK